MWRRTVVVAAVAAIYLLLPLDRNDATLRETPKTYGKPFTQEIIVAMLEGEGLRAELDGGTYTEMMTNFRPY
jgi:hypothetical protein